VTRQGGTTATDRRSEAGRDRGPAGTLRIADFSDVTTFDPALAQITHNHIEELNIGGITCWTEAQADAEADR
jgi:hypothetical protein